MLNQLSISEKVSTAIAACVIAASALLLCLRLTLAPSYSDFIVGSITWYAGTKLQDIIAIPVFALALVFAFLLLATQTCELKKTFNNDCATQFSNQLLWWSIPPFCAIFSLASGGVIDKKLFLLVSSGIIYISVVSAYHLRKRIIISPDLVGLSGLAIILVALIPLEIALLLGRAPMSLVGSINASYFLEAVYITFGFSLVLGFYGATFHSNRYFFFLPKLLLFAQIGLPVFVLTLFPARLLEPTGALSKYETTIWLKILLVGFVLWGVFDVVNRYRRFAITENCFKILSPIAIFSLLIALRVGNTVSPFINSDDYHFGESLLGWWMYSSGTTPYIGYIPPHGLVDDDLVLFISSIFYDGSAGSVADAGRLTFGIVAFIAFISLYYFFGSIGLVAVSIFFLGGRLAWFFFTPFLCLWFAKGLRRNPSKWLMAWMVSAPLVILGVPPQGLLLVAASGAMAAYFAWLQIRSPQKGSWYGLGICVTTLVVLGLFTPLGAILFGAVRYLLENGPINQVAYGVPWGLSWGAGVKAGFIFEAVRTSWVVVTIICIAAIYIDRKNYTDRGSIVYPAFVVLLFTLLLIPYSMGRIDPGSIARSGVAAIFCWTVLLPLVLWTFVKTEKRVLLIFSIACVSALFNLSNFSLSALASATSSMINTSKLRDGKEEGFINIGKAHVQDEHWNRLTTLNAVLKNELSTSDTYLDLTSRNAQYFYLDRRPIIAVTAPYNMVSVAQQKRVVEQLSKNLPKLALLQGDNIIHDGGGLALRNPYLYRFVVDNYTPRYERGFIIGLKKSEVSSGDESIIDVSVKDVTDKDWIGGLHRSEAAIVVADPAVTAFVKVGDLVHIGMNQFRAVRKVWSEGSVIWLEGAPLVPPPSAKANRVQVISSRQMATDYRVSLLQRSFSQSDLKKIPVAWGKAVKSLEKRMSLVKSFSGIPINSYQTTLHRGVYKVIGPDPQLSLDITHLNLSGHDSGLLRFDFVCIEKAAEPKIQVFWWGDDQDGPTEFSSIRFTAEDGTMIVPVDASPHWLTLKKVKGIRIDLENASACGAISLNNMALYQRLF